MARHRLCEMRALILFRSGLFLRSFLRRFFHFLLFGSQARLIFFLLGFVPGYVVSLVLKGMGMLRVPEGAELAGMDTVKVPAQGYPEGIPTSPAPAE